MSKELHNMMETKPNAHTHKIALIDEMVLLHKFYKRRATLVTTSNLQQQVTDAYLKL